MAEKNTKGSAPIYQQIADQLEERIQKGLLPAGSKLPTVRALAGEHEIALGTAKLVYDTLESRGVIEKTQGRGTFVKKTEVIREGGKKEAAMEAIDQMLDRLQELGISKREIRIFLDLKLREREKYAQGVKIGVVDCSPEALSVIANQISALPYAEVYDYLLEALPKGENQFSPGMDLMVTTNTHAQELAHTLTPDYKLIPVVMSITPETVSELARIPRKHRVGILCVSERFAGVIQKACSQYCQAAGKMEVFYFSQEDQLGDFLKRVDTLILPSNYLNLCSWGVQEMLADSMENCNIIEYRYQIDRGSLLFLEDEIQGAYQRMQ